MAITTITSMAPMAFSLFTSSLYIFLCLSPSLAIPSSSSSNTHISNSTPYPFFCKGLLPNNNSASVQDQGRFSIRRAMAQTRDYLSLVNRILESKNCLPQSTICALEDCQLLIGLNMDFLSNAMQAVNSKYALTLSQADDKHTFLSAVLTNHQTCLDGLLETNSNSIPQTAALSPLQDGNVLYCVSLALFKQGWVRNQIKKTRLSDKRRDSSELYELVVNRERKLDNTKVNNVVAVCLDGSRNFTSINDAVAAAPNISDVSDGFFVIHVTAGVYNEYVVVPKNKRYVMMIGDGINNTIITGDRSVKDEWSTFRSATFSVFGFGFVGVNMTIRNTAGAIKGQAVALVNTADQSAFYKCSFEGYQDTLYTHSNRQFYKSCDVYGTIDFIFGTAAVVLQDCNIFARLPIKNQYNVITAQGRKCADQNSGISIQSCMITAGPDLAAANRSTLNTYLGRPWREYSSTVYMESRIDGLVDPAGWKAWGGNSTLDTLYYGEFCNYGPGSNTTGRVTWPGYHLINSSAVAVEFTVSRFILGDEWLPATAVPYSSGLV